MPIGCCRFGVDENRCLAEMEEAAEGPISAENKRVIDAAYEILKNETLPDGRPLKIVPEHLVFRGSQDNPTVMGAEADENGGVAFDGTRWPRATTASSTPAATATSSCATTGVEQRYWHLGHGSEDQGEGRARQGGAQERPSSEVVMLDTC